MPDEYASSRNRLRDLARNRMKSPYSVIGKQPGGRMDTNLGRGKPSGPRMGINPPRSKLPIKGGTNLGKPRGGKVISAYGKPK